MSQGASANAHAVIDGSNLATEGRSEPSLAQLDEAVRAIDAEFDFAQITVIVDATFEHRVDKSETKAARAAIDDGDIITPPAGVIGRGDAFILEVADRADAVVFSNDSFQEFHGTYDWLFDEGRLVGGKPIPGVGWIYVARSPVRGPVSRRATAESRRAEKATKKATKAARKATKKAAKRTRGSAKDEGSNAGGRRGRNSADTSAKDAGAKDMSSRDRGSRDRGSSRSRRQSSASASEGRNDPALWSTFRDDFPVGSTIAARVERFSSHGAYGSVDDVVVYLPNRLLGDPPPTKARDVLEVGTTMDFVVHRYDEERKGIDAGLIPVDGADGDDRNNQHRTKESNVAKKAAKKATKKRPAKKAPAKKAAAKKAPAKKAAAKKTAAKKTAKKAPAKKTAKKAPAKKTAAKKTAKKAPAKKTAAKKTAKKAPAKKTAAKKTAKKSTAKKAARKTTKRR